MPDRTCAVCSHIFTARPTQIYCSPRCKNVGGARLRRTRNEAKAERRCYRCHLVKPAAEFSSPTKSYCRPCGNAYQREYAPPPASRDKRLRWRRENETYDRPTRVQYLYGISPKKYQEILDAQGGGCAICNATAPGGRWNTWHVDHDHGHCPGKRACESCVRGLLCAGCNLGLGYFRDNPEALRAALRYLGERQVTRDAHDYVQRSAPEGDCRG